MNIKPTTFLSAAKGACGLLLIPLFLLLAASTTQAQVVAWALDKPTDVTQLVRVNLGSGEVTTLADLVGREPSGLAFDGDDRLWTVDLAASELVELDPFSGLELGTREVVLPAQIEDVDITFDPCGRLYLIDRLDPALGTGSLYLIDELGALMEIGTPDRELRSISSIDGRLVALARRSNGDRALVDVDRSNAGTYSPRNFELEPPNDSWIAFDPNGTLWGVDPASPVGPPMPSMTWTAAPGNAGRTLTAVATALVEPHGLAIGAPEGVCSTGCVEGANQQCFVEGRFEVKVQLIGDQVVPAKTVLSRSDDSGLFTFFDPDNWEVMVKVLDGCALNDHFWVFSAAATDQPHRVIVTDTLTNEQETFDQPAGPSVAINDTQAFATCDLQ